jgi:hypothetical protein
MVDENVRWEGELLTGGRAPTPIKARIIKMQGVYLDEITGLGPGLRMQAFEPKDREWRKKTPYEFNAASLAIALSQTVTF